VSTDGHYTEKCQNGAQPNSTHPKTISIVLHICRDSRAVAQSIFKILPWYSRRSISKQYYNVLYDNLHIGGGEWDQFKILIDILIRRNTTRPLLTGVQKDLWQLLDIQRLVVDLNTVGAVAASIWADFEKLETLATIFYPFSDINDVDNDSYGLTPKLCQTPA
jgi:hypothetical protein